MLEVRTDQVFGHSQVQPPGSPSRSWTTVIFAGGVIGAVCGTLGIVISLLTLVGLIARTRVSAGVTVALIVIALSSLFGAAHGMDKIREVEIRERHERFMRELTKED